MRGWRPALRIARRELLRAKGRTVVVLLMVLLPVTAVVCLSTLLRTSEIDVVEGLPVNLGDAAARLEVAGGIVEQDPLLRSSAQYDAAPAPSEDQLRAALPAGSRLLPVRERYEGSVQVGDRRRRISTVAVDLADAALRGPYQVLDGRAPAGPGEVAVTVELAQDGLPIGSTVQLPVGERRVAGVVARPHDHGSRAVVGTAEAVGLDPEVDPYRYYVAGPPVGWDDVQRLNALGVLVLSREVVLDPPPDDEVRESGFSSGQDVTLAIIGLIAVMAVLEVVLLAGPAFAVGARRQRRGLALLAATGGDPSDVRRVVLAQGLLVGAVAAVVGAPLGIAVAALARAPLSRWADAQWGPFDVGWLDVLLVALLGAATALLAALGPAWVMARQPLVAALQGRRVTAAGAARPALVGLVLLTVGLVITVGSLRDQRFTYHGYAELGVAAGAIPTVLGAVLLAPAALTLVGRLAGRLPLALRFAVRDADRQRGRTAPAVAAIAATVAGVIALGTAASSDAEQNRLTYRADGPAGVAVVTAGGLDADWDVLETAARGALPGEPVQAVRGLPPSGPVSPDGFVETQVCRVGERADQGRCYELMSDYASSYGSDLLVGRQALGSLEPQLRPALVPRARDVLASGGVLLSARGLQPGEQVELRRTRFTLQEDGTERAEVLETVTAPAAPLPVSTGFVPTRAVLSERVADRLGGARTVGLLVGEDLSRAEEEALQDAVLAVDDGAYVRVERGYDDRADRTVVLVLSLVAGALVLAGTLAATALALSEARPDLSTLGQVGARPRTRKAVAAGYALVLGLVGALLGVLAGLIPGVAASVPLTRGISSSSGYAPLTAVPPGRDFIVDIPWLLIALVLVVLPLVSAAVAGAATRSRLDGPTRRLA